MRHSTPTVPAQKIIYDISEYGVFVGGILELLTCLFICICCLFKKSRELRTGFYTILSIGFWIDSVWTIVYFIYKFFPVNPKMLIFAMDIQMFAVLVTGPWIFVLGINRYVAMVLPQKYSTHFNFKRTSVYGIVIFAVGVFYVGSRHANIDEYFLIKLGQNLTIVFCLVAFGYGLEAIRSQKKCEWRKQIEDRKFLYLTLTITVFQLIANISSAYVITWQDIKKWEDWQLTYFFTGINAAICGAQYSGVVLFFLFSQPAKDMVYRIIHCQEPLRNRIRPLAFIE